MRAGLLGFVVQMLEDGFVETVAERGELMPTVSFLRRFGLFVCKGLPGAGVVHAMLP